MPDKADLWTVSGRGDNQEVELVPEAKTAIHLSIPVNPKQYPFQILMVKVWLNILSWKAWLGDSSQHMVTICEVCRWRSQLSGGS